MSIGEVDPTTPNLTSTIVSRVELSAERFPHTTVRTDLGRIIGTDHRPSDQIADW